MLHLLEKGRTECVIADHKHPREEDNFKLVYASGITENNEKLVDGDFDIQAENAVKLVRTVEMYQWVEQRHNGNNNQHHYTYSKEWKPHHVSSHGFHQSHHDNPSEMPFTSKTLKAKNVKFGGYVLSESQIDRLNKQTQVKISEDMLAKANNTVAKILKGQRYGEFHL